jgi:hypothetical protein
MGQNVVVDNTNVRKSDYAFYRDKAEAAEYSVCVLEIICENTTELEKFRKRSVHDVPGSATGNMWSRWEHDNAALRLTPYIPQQLMPWLTQHGLVGHPPYTHLIMPTGPFLSVSAGLRDEFFCLIEEDLGQHYISEQAPPDAFQLFFDIDKLELERLLLALASLQAIVGALPLVVTGTNESPPGHHIFVPGKIVNVERALAVCDQWLQEFLWLEPHVDRNIYRGGKQSFVGGPSQRGPALRLVGSRKISKEGVDLGRVHKVLGRFDSTWEAGAAWKWSDVSIMAPTASVSRDAKPSSS